MCACAHSGARRGPRQVPPTHMQWLIILEHRHYKIRMTVAEYRFANMAGVVKGGACLFEALNVASDAVPAGTSLVYQLDEFVDAITSAVNYNIEKLKALHDDKIDCGGWEREVCRALRRVVEKAFVYASSVDQLIRYGGDQARNTMIREKLHSGDLRELIAYISQLQRCLVKVKDPTK